MGDLANRVEVFRSSSVVGAEAGKDEPNHRGLSTESRVLALAVHEALCSLFGPVFSETASGYVTAKFVSTKAIANLTLSY